MTQGRTEVAINTLPFWSRFVQSIDLRWDGQNCQRRHISRGAKIPVFDYRQGEGQVNALEGQLATERDTILVKAAQTRGGGLYRIYGISITKDGGLYVAEGDDKLEHHQYPGMSVQPCNQAQGPVCPSVEDQRSLENLVLDAFLKTFRMELKIDGSRRTIEMGPVVLYPGVGGIKSTISPSNGDVFNSNFMPIREGIVWNPSGAVDSNMVCLLEAAYDLYTPTWTTPTGTANGEPVSQDNPEIEGAVRTAIGRKWSQGYILNFHGREESPSSNVS
jgi:hypothetical protein